MRPFELVVAFDTARPEQSVPGRLLALLVFWNRPSAPQNGLNKQQATAAGQRAVGSATLVQVDQIPNTQESNPHSAVCTSDVPSHW